MSVNSLLLSLDEMGDHDLGKISHSEDGHWVLGDDSHFPIQIDPLLNIDEILIYGTFVKTSGEPIYTPILTSMMLENMVGTTLDGYGICPGPVTFSIYSKISIFAMTPEQMIELIAGMRQLIDYIRISTAVSGDYVDLPDRHENDTLLPPGMVH
ncbi:MAG: hypothetical protein CBC12_14265 [Candidatus Puniceispirillum sp. TMED52]|nr:hypothetical protein [SAR116 cluster bacterium]OUU43335.1 MAG: hypothetical protein CBC12_14265 [Candidatus Puniceispirillum sp. TMED52]HCP18740.1 hypothetical protein [Alphaproteobacteria bacterium]